MLIILNLLLLLSVGCCMDRLTIETKTVGIGQNVTLTCPRHTFEYGAKLFWIRLVSGNFHEVLGGTSSVDRYDEDKNPLRLTVKQEPGTFVLNIQEMNPSDAGVYYCIKVYYLAMSFLKGTFLKIRESEHAITTVSQKPPSNPVHPSDSVTLQCSVLYDSENKKCSEDPSAYWIRAGSDESHHSVIYVTEHMTCEKKEHFPHKCSYSFSKSINSSEARMYYCAVAACGEILFGNGIKQDIQGLKISNSQNSSNVQFLLYSALATSLIIIFILICAIKKKSTAAVGAQRNAAGGDDWSCGKMRTDSVTLDQPSKKDKLKMQEEGIKNQQQVTPYK